MSAAASNCHATALIVADRGVLIMGPSGSGKTALALTLIDQATAAGRLARLVADDQLFLSTVSGRLLARAPSTTAGLAEARGFGPAPVKAEPLALIDLAVLLVAADVAPRMHEAKAFEWHGVTTGQLVLPARDTVQATLAIAAWFGWSAFTQA